MFTQSKKKLKNIGYAVWVCAAIGFSIDASDAVISRQPTNTTGFESCMSPASIVSLDSSTVEMAIDVAVAETLRYQCGTCRNPEQCVACSIREVVGVWPAMSPSDDAFGGDVVDLESQRPFSDARGQDCVSPSREHDFTLRQFMAAVRGIDGCRNVMSRESSIASSSCTTRSTSPVLNPSSERS